MPSLQCKFVTVIYCKSKWKACPYRVPSNKGGAEGSENAVRAGDSSRKESSVQCEVAAVLLKC